MGGGISPKSVKKSVAKRKRGIHVKNKRPHCLYDNWSSPHGNRNYDFDQNYLFQKTPNSKNRKRHSKKIIRWQYSASI